MENTKVDATVDKSKMTSFRCLIAYWILGLCNNYGYVVMLTAANDIIKEYSTSTEEKNYERNCTYLSTGAILLADVLPALLIKALAPFIPFFVHIRVAICVLISAGGFLLVAFSNSMEIAILGVALTSLVSGLGEVTFLQYSSFYHKNVVSTWSSGTGGAGVIGAISYSLLHYIGMRLALKIMIIIPIIMGLTFWILLPKPFGENILEVQKEVNTLELKSPREAIKYKLKLIPGLLKYIIPFSLVYLFEYFINQGTFELIDFRNSFVDQNEQYRWLQVSYQVGVLISRSSVNCVHIRHIWILSVLQLINVIIYTTEVIYFYIPNFIIMIVLTIWEGLLGGSAYVNTYYTISSEVNEKDKQFSLAITGFGDSIGITLAGVLSMIVHNKICDLPVPENIP